MGEKICVDFLMWSWLEVNRLSQTETFLKMTLKSYYPFLRKRTIFRRCVLKSLEIKCQDDCNFQIQQK